VVPVRVRLLLQGSVLWTADIEPDGAAPVPVHLCHVPDSSLMVFSSCSLPAADLVYRPNLNPNPHLPPFMSARACVLCVLCVLCVVLCCVLLRWCLL
jgi:hypothetical protein